ncbi:MAG: diguanylate cyclase [Deltaproteobacteria bacterium]|nr:diguanylate cyclase [Deltaproteobacteria bacterium]
MHKQILDNIETGVLVVNRLLDISYWNRWLEIHTGIDEDSAVGNNLENLFSDFSFGLLKQKIHIAVKLGTPTFVNGRVSGYVIPIEQYKVTKSIFRFMQQDATITPIGDGLVSIVVTDVSPLLEAHYTIDKQMKMLERQARTDFLTGCFNKNMFNDILSTEMKRSERHGHVFTLIIFDIDDFKLVNDTHGHLAGDAVLRQMAEIVVGSIRQSDALIRWGGEEFFILLPETALEGGALLAEKLRRRIRKFDFEKAGRLSCSFGVAQWKNEVGEDGIIGMADSALYLAKNSGKNRVCVFSNGQIMSWSESLDPPPIAPLEESEES